MWGEWERGRRGQTSVVGLAHNFSFCASLLALNDWCTRNTSHVCISMPNQCEATPCVHINDWGVRLGIYRQTAAWAIEHGRICGRENEKKRERIAEIWRNRGKTGTTRWHCCVVIYSPHLLVPLHTFLGLCFYLALSLPPLPPFPSIQPPTPTPRAFLLFSLPPFFLRAASMMEPVIQLGIEHTEL